MAWLILILAGAFEILGVILLNQHAATQQKRYIILLGIGFFISFSLLSIAMNLGLPMGTAYAVWTGIGTVGGTIVGMLFYNESKRFLRILCICIIIFATIGLKFIS